MLVENAVSIDWVNKAKEISKPRVRFEAHQYDENDMEINVFHSANEIYAVPEYKKYYYRVFPFLSSKRSKEQTLHFGVSVSNECSNRFDMGDYWNQYFNALLTMCTEKDDIVCWFTSNLRFHYEAFKTLAKLELSELNAELEHFIKRYPSFIKVTDIRLLQRKAGLYLLVLDDYACCYIGQSKDIKRRIQQHWRTTNYSTTGIDMFKALDTTRIYACLLGNSATQRKIDRLEYQFIHSINRDYLLNCFGGGGSLEFIHLDLPNMGYRGALV